MLIAATMQKSNGRRALVIGLDDENMRRLRNDKPIRKSLNDDPRIDGLEDWDLIVLGPEDMARFAAHFGGAS